jgi:hypothetical protein
VQQLLRRSRLATRLLGPLPVSRAARHRRSCNEVLGCPRWRRCHVEPIRREQPVLDGARGTKAAPSASPPPSAQQAALVT